MSEGAEAVTPRRSKILIVDDDADSREVYSLALEQWGYETLEAESGEAALRCLAEGPELPDVVLTDLSLPGVAGGDLVRQLRADSRVQKIPIIVLTGFGPGPNVEEVRDAGVDLVITKPCTADALAGHIAQVLGR